MQKSYFGTGFHGLVAALLLLLSFDSFASTQSRVLKGPDGKPVKNAELWQRLDALVHGGVHQIEWSANGKSIATWLDAMAAAGRIQGMPLRRDQDDEC